METMDKLLEVQEVKPEDQATATAVPETKLKQGRKFSLYGGARAVILPKGQKITASPYKNLNVIFPETQEALEYLEAMVKQGKAQEIK